MNELSVILIGLFLGLGVVALSEPKIGVWLFTVAVLATPSSNAVADLTYANGLYCWDYFFLVLLVAYPFRVLMGREQIRSQELLLLAFVLCVGVGVAMSAAIPIDKYFLRDLRPFLFVLEALMLFSIFSATAPASPEKNQIALGIVASLSVFAGYAILRLGLISDGDVYYEENSYRYLAIGSYVSALILVASPTYFARWSRFSFVWAWMSVILCVIAVILSGSRVLVVGTALGCLIGGSLSSRRLIVAAVLGVTLVGGLAFLTSDIERVSGATTGELIGEQLTTRYGPAMSIIQEMDALDLLIGKGVGTTFEIPWFEYRGKDIDNNFVDSAYLTLFTKFGFLSLLYFALLYGAFGIEALHPLVARGILLFLILMGITMAVPYQGIAIGIPLALAHLTQGLDMKLESETAELEASLDVAVEEKSVGA